MSHYDVFSAMLFVGLVIFLILSVYGAYHKGCRDTWRAADEITQVKPIFSPAAEPRPIELQSSPLRGQEMVLALNCRECHQDE